jgi:two-component system, LytTR family, sensor kinase
MKLRGWISTFALLNLCAWLSYGLLSFVAGLPYVGLVPHLNSVASLFANRAAFVVVGLIGSAGLRRFFQHQRRRSASLPGTVVWGGLLAYAASLIATCFANWARQQAGGHLVGTWASLFGGALGAFAIFLCWCACYLAAQSYEDVQVERQNVLQAKAIAQEARFEALRGQLNPHFLFNSLNSIQALIGESPSKAQVAVGHLAVLLRNSLSGNKDVGSLRESVDAIERYLAMEKIRFEENLIARIEMDRGLDDWQIPRFLLHPLVENAVRYGMQTSPMPLQVCVRSFQADGNLCLEVANSGRWCDPAERREFQDGNGIGLRLVREQLEHAYPGRYEATRIAEDGWVVQRIRVTPAEEISNALSCIAHR